MSAQPSLFDRVALTTGLPAYIGPSTVRRALAVSACREAEVATASDYLGALPELKARMSIYLPTAEVESRVREIERLLQTTPGDL